MARRNGTLPLLVTFWGRGRTFHNWKILPEQIGRAYSMFQRRPVDFSSFDFTVGWQWKMSLKGTLGYSKVSPLCFSPGSRACPCDGKNTLRFRFGSILSTYRWNTGRMKASARLQAAVGLHYILMPDDGRFMIRAASWNVRGLNGLDHQRAVEQLDYSGPAGRIWLAWNSLEVGVETLEVGIQFIHYRAFNKRMHTRCLISVLYGDYDIIPRRELWSALRNLSTGILAEPWLVLGDFNAVIDESEVCGQAADTSASMVGIRNCIRDTGLVQLPFTGCPYTWHNCSEGPRSLWKRLDRMLANEAWLDTWPSSSYLSALPAHQTILH
ncbi:hypothetical protein Sango_2889300 [Sesamum angolense]|uniref:Endonuclease/exonuclease/phosphatase domain-containing protein n=1 Tax=Sesamum angolense TaxID=2727404 RepID=A0AAE1W033_9LAMI|nr:hypothetical protein Sango_2889300 [Sesamum angolense]